MDLEWHHPTEGGRAADGRSISSPPQETRVTIEGYVELCFPDLHKLI